MIFKELGEYEQSLASLKSALELRIQSLGPKHLDISESYHEIGSVYSFLEKYDKSIKYFQKALKIQLKFFNENIPNVLRSYHNIGFCYFCFGKHKKALSYYKKSLKIKLLEKEDRYPDFITTYNEIGFTFHELKRYQKALIFFQKALKIRLKDQEKKSQTLTEYGSAASLEDPPTQKDKAVKFEKIDLQDSNIPVVIDAYFKISLAYDELEDKDKAAKFFKMGYDMQLQIPSKETKPLDSYQKIVKVEVDKYKKLVNFRRTPFVESLQ